MSCNIFQMVLTIIAGLGIFLLGMKNMSEGMQAVAGDKLRRMISAVTSNRLVACGMGAFITCLIQSSSITTVMAVGMVNAGVMTLIQAIGVIMGANIGTTITGWILVLQIGKYGLPIMGIAAFFFLFSKRERIRYTAMIFLGIGMVFFGLHEMKEGFRPLREMPEFIMWFSRFQPTTYFGVLKCCLVGAALTVVVQSSSATLGITMGLASTGIIPVETACALVLGENIGTTITAYLASLGASVNAKRASYAHIAFNLLGAAWITSIFAYYLRIVFWLVERFLGVDIAVATGPAADDARYAVYVTTCIAASHTVFNIVNTILFLPLAMVLAAALTRLAPDREAVPETPHLAYLDVVMLGTPSLGIEQSKRAIVRMAETVEEMLTMLRRCIEAPQPHEKDKNGIFDTERNLDVYQKEIVEYLSSLLKGTVPQEVMQQARGQLRMADEYESVGDYIETVLKLLLRLNKSGEKITPEGLRELLTLHDQVADYLQLVGEAVRNDSADILIRIGSRSKAINHAVRDYRQTHMVRVERGDATPLKSLVFTDMLTAFRRLKDHGLNIAQVVAGRK